MLRAVCGVIRAPDQLRLVWLWGVQGFSCRQPEDVPVVYLPKPGLRCEVGCCGNP